MKEFISLVILIIFEMSLYLSPVFPFEQNPEKHVYNFYRWYFDKLADTKSLPEYNNEITKYVYASTLNKIKINYEKELVSFDYFTKSQDYGDEYLANVDVQQHIVIDEYNYLVPVSFNFKNNFNYQVVVFVKRENDLLYIIKVEDTKY